MSGEARAYLRRALDAHARSRVAAFVESGELRLCAGCDGPTEGRTPGCKTCFDRVRNRGRERMDSINGYRRRRNARRRALHA